MSKHPFRTLVEMARAAQRDDRQSTGALYGDLADRIEALEAEIKEWRMIVENLESQIKADLALSPAPEGEAVAWQKRPVFGDIRLRVWTPVEADPEVQDFWRMVNYEIRPLYATPQSISTREAVIEECAKLCEGLRHVDYPSETSEWSSGTFDCAQAIRALGTGS